jgi:sugar O-acyltransferase (sialic acid O-acetyltransferase NeuD family)
MTDVVIWGCGGHGREVSLLCEQAGVRVRGFLDERPEMKGQLIDGVPVLGALDDVRAIRDHVSIVCSGVGDPVLKRRFSEMTAAGGFRLSAPIVHPSVHPSSRVSIGPGTVVCAGVVMTVNVCLGRHVIVNVHATISHDASIGDFATLAPGVNVCGGVAVGEGAYLGVGCSVRERSRIGAWSVIGGGAFVRTDVPERVLYAGVPAVFRKHLP